MSGKYFFIIYLLYASTVLAQNKSKYHEQMFSADLNLGYNMARNESNYWFEEKMPYSFQLNWQRANYEKQETLNIFGYSDFGATFLYHDFRNDILGKNYSFYAFMEYYLWHPSHRLQLSFRLSQGVAYNTNPFDKNSNPKNKLFGSHILFPFDLAFYLKYPKIYGHWGVQLGWAVFHYSNGNIQSPNYGANIPSITLGVNYDFREIDRQLIKTFPEYDKKWKYHLFLRFGINKSDYSGSDVYPFLIPGFQIDKHLNFRHKINFGAELFFSWFLQEQIRYEYYSMPENHMEKIYDFKRMGVYIGHEFYYKKMAIDFAAGYYIYYPYEFETRFYNRLGTRFYLSKNWTGLCTLKIHDLSRAEAVELGLMYQIN